MRGQGRNAAPTVCAEPAAVEFSLATAHFFAMAGSSANLTPRPQTSEQLL
jgi:hypothetical protein